MALSRSRAWILVAPLLAAACSLAIDTDRTFKSDLTPGDSGTGGGDSDAPTNECVTGTRECAGTTLSECVEGRWETRECEAPNPVCVGNECGVCGPGESGCSGQKTAYHCENGAKVETQCPVDAQFCEHGDCFECTSGQTRCTSETQLQSCVEGHWRDEPPCRDTKQCETVESVGAGCFNNRPPQVFIDTPANNTKITVEDSAGFVSLNFRGHAFDLDNLTGASEDLSGQIEWQVYPATEFDNVQSFGPGAEVLHVSLATTSSCAPGGKVYYVVAEVTDRAGAIGSAFALVAVVKMPLCP